MKFSWIPFYTELADKLLQYKANRKPLVDWIYNDLKDIRRTSGRPMIQYLHEKDGSNFNDIDPFSVLAIFNRGIKESKRLEYLKKYKEFFKISADLPKDFDSIPLMNNMNAHFMSWDRTDSSYVDRLWNFYDKLLNDKDGISDDFNWVISLHNISFSITIAMYWMRPYEYLALDANNRALLKELGIANITSMPDYNGYTKILSDYQQKINDGEMENLSYPEFSYKAWGKEDHQVTQEDSEGEEDVQEDNTSETHYWLYTPGEKGSKWDYCQENSCICVSFEGMNDFRKYKTRDEMLKEWRNVQNSNASFKNDTLGMWEFCHVMKPGDIVYAKIGIDKVVGRGVVESDYDYRSDLPNYRHVRKVKWTHIGEWPHPGKAVLKTLTDISKYPGYVNKLELLICKEGGPRYWWLVASPSVWSYSDIKIGEVIDFTLFNDDGHKRHIFQNFLDARKGDIVIGYESTPRKEINTILEVDREQDGKYIYFKKKEVLLNPIPLSDFKDDSSVKNMEFFANRGSLFMLTEDEYNTLLDDYIRERNPLPEAKKIDTYTKEDFFREVYVDNKDFDKLINLLKTKKNIILQGAPGVGKTYSAMRLAYAFMGKKDKAHIEFVQFHQNYSYEDFIMGFKPTEDGGFKLNEGIFYKFCKKAEIDPDNPYFFIIDEINRGNLSKIFGELLMLIENSYRGVQIRLAYSDVLFSIPKNIYIIGMMNTADRSLAMIDYALRRRFSFFDMKPGFDSAGFIKYQNSINNPKFERIINGIKKLNETIISDDSLGKGFCIGHSYFCNLEKFDEEQIDNIIEYDIIPMLSEYWFDNEQKFKDESKKLMNLLQ